MRVRYLICIYKNHYYCVTVYNWIKKAFYLFIIHVITIHSSDRGSTFQILSAYSLMTRSVEKKPMRATLVIDFAIHSSWSRNASSTSSWVVRYERKSSDTR